MGLKMASFSNLAMCHLRLGNTERARDCCTKALNIDPTNVKALFRRGKCHSQLGGLDEAKADLERVSIHAVKTRSRCFERISRSAASVNVPAFVPVSHTLTAEHMFLCCVLCSRF